MATEKKETTKDASKKKDSSAESAVKKSPPKKRTAKSKQTTQKTGPKAAKSAAKKTKATKSKTTKTTKSATPTTAAKKRSQPKAAGTEQSVPKSATDAVVVSETVAEPPADAGAKTTASPTETNAPETATDDADKTAAPDVQEAAPSPPKDTSSAPPVPAPPPSKTDASDKSATASDRPQPPPPSPGISATEGDRPKSVLLYLGLGLALVISLIVFASLFNMSHYYLKSANGALEIWQGKFSPKGIKRLLIMPGVQPPEETKPVYEKKEVYPIAFQYYIDKADTLMGVAGLPDFGGIKSDLYQARSYALNEAQHQMVKNRLNRIELTVLLYKADVTAGKGTLADLEKAEQYLQQAAALNPDEIETRLIDQKLASINALMAALRQPAAESAPPEPEPETSADIDVSSDDGPSQPPPQPETAVAPESPATHSEESQ